MHTIIAMLKRARLGAVILIGGSVWAFSLAASGGFEGAEGVCFYGGSETTDGSCGGVLMDDRAIAWLAPTLFLVGVALFIRGPRMRAWSSIKNTALNTAHP